MGKKQNILTLTLSLKDSREIEIEGKFNMIRNRSATIYESLNNESVFDERSKHVIFVSGQKIEGRIKIGRVVTEEHSLSVLHQNFKFILSTKVIPSISINDESFESVQIFFAPSTSMPQNIKYLNLKEEVIKEPFPILFARNRKRNEPRSLF